MFSFLFSNNPSNRLIAILCLLATTLVIVIIVNRINEKAHYEGFTQDEKFVIKTDNDIYDEFYVQIYDKLFKRKEYSSFEMDVIFKNTQPTQQSLFLDVGSGTGCLVNKIQTSGYKAIGIDLSLPMVEYSKEQYPDIRVKHGDILSQDIFPKNIFSHILCTNMAIYQFEDKKALVQRVSSLLQSNGYFIVHLVERNTFNSIIPLGNPTLLDNPQKYSNRRITDTIIDFIDFKYKGSYDFTKTERVCLKETFTDEQTGHVRQNENILYMDELVDIISIVKTNGFVVHSKMAMKDFMGDENQFYYIFEKIT
jgi:SAM-dependent methyltransferase